MSTAAPTIRTTPLPVVQTGNRLAIRKDPSKKKVCMVTGGAAGIGARTAVRFAAEGGDVVIADLPAQKERAQGVIDSIKALKNNAKAIFVELDAASESSWESCMATVEKELGPISVLVNGAGISGYPPMNIEDLDFSLWRRVQSVNLDGVMLGCKHGARSMLKLPRDWDKSIINISSILGLVGNETSISYAASKAGVRNLSKAVALNLATRGTGIRSNSVHPGYVESDMTNNAVSDEKFKVGCSVMGRLWCWIDLAFGWLQTIADLHAVKRFGNVDELASMILFLASEESSFCVGSE